MFSMTKYLQTTVLGCPDIPKIVSMLKFSLFYSFWIKMIKNSFLILWVSGTEVKCLPKRIADELWPTDSVSLCTLIKPKIRWKECTIERYNLMYKEMPSPLFSTQILLLELQNISARKSHYLQLFLHLHHNCWIKQFLFYFIIAWDGLDILSA